MGKANRNRQKAQSLMSAFHPKLTLGLLKESTVLFVDGVYKRKDRSSQGSADKFVPSEGGPS